MHYNTHLYRETRRIIGSNIRRLRTEQKLTLEKLERLSGVRHWRIDRYELGKDEIRLKDILKLACALGVGMGRLIHV